MKEIEDFRDHLSTADNTGGRVWMCPTQPSGRFYEYRKWVSYVFVLLFLGLPFVRIHDQPMFLFNIMERKFIVFGMIFMPQDFFLFGLAMLTFAVFIVLFTSAFGRLWCGWACPQTVFMEMIFRRVEYWIEGDGNEQRKLNAKPWDVDKTITKWFKYTVFFLISFLIANVALAYMIGTDALFGMMKEGIFKHPKYFIGVTAFTGLFYFVFAYMREQACIIVCPYGRLQGVLLDKNSIVVAYDYERGEPRGKAKKNDPAPAAHGDCIDCGLCVRVCPTGIDIRNGTQLECVNCTACIDACDGIMDKVEKPRGLIRYASENQIAKKQKFRVSPRMVGYSALLVLLLGVFGFSMATRSPVGGSFLRTPGMTYQTQPDGRISNLYTFDLVNKSHTDLNVEFKLEDTDGEIKFVGKSDVLIHSAGYAKGEVFIILKPEQITHHRTDLKIGIWSGGIKLQTMIASFIGPIRD